MNRQLLLVWLNALVRAPGGVACLKEALETLAVRGFPVSEVADAKPARARAPEVGENEPSRHGGPTSSGDYSLPAGWVWSRVSDVATPQPGFAFASSGFNTTRRGMPLIRIRDIAATETQVYFDGAYRPEFIVQPGDLLIGMDGKFHLSFWKGPRALLNQRVARLLFHAPVEREFVALALQQRLRGLQGTKAYTTVDHLSGRQISDALIPLPPIGEQRTILDRLASLTKLVDQVDAARTRQASARDRFRRAACQALASATRLSDTVSAWSQLEASVNDILQAPEDTDELRSALIQTAIDGRWAAMRADTSRWTPRALGDVVSILTGPFGTALKRADYVEGGTPVINPQHLHDGQIVPSAAATVDIGTLRRLDAYRVHEGDVILARRGEMGRCAVVSPQQDGWLCGTGSLILRPTKSLDPFFLAWYLRAPRTMAALQGMAVGSTMLNLNQRIVGALPLTLPTLSDQVALVAGLRGALATLDRLRAALTDAEENSRAIVDALPHLLIQ